MNKQKTLSLLYVNEHGFGLRKRENFFPFNDQVMSPG